jgi:GT2 family glycosyltransferase
VSAAAPEIAVVIPTRNRETRLAFALEALARQTLDRDRFEVIVVRSEDAIGPHATAPDGLAVRFLEHGGARGPGAQRNTGWRATRAPVIAFTDDDCRPAPDWLERMLAASRNGALVQGCTYPDPEERHLLLGFARSIEIIGPSDWYETCNIAYPRDLLEELGGFDEDFTFSAEDVDLGLRARAAGADRVFEVRSIVLHAVLAYGLRDALRSARARNSTPLLISRHPEQRRRLPLRVFWKPSHARLLLALAGLAVARRRPLLCALMLLPYLDLYVGWRVAATPRGLVRVLVDLAGRVVVDATEVVVTIRGAARERVILL